MDFLYTDESPINVTITQTQGARYNPAAFGAVGDGVADDTLAIQQTIDAAIAGQGVVILDPKTYKITSTLIIRDVDGFRMSGYGAGASSIAGAILYWQGDAVSAAVQLASCRNSHFENISIFCIDPLLIGIEIRRVSGATTNAARNTITNVEVNGITDKLGTAFVVSCDVGQDANNDFNVFQNCIASNYGAAGELFTDPAGFSIRHSQSLGNMMLNCQAIASATGSYGCTNAVGSGALGSFHWVGGGTAFNTVAAFHCGVGSGGITVEKTQSENDARLLLTTGPGRIEMPVSLRNCRYNPVDSLASDNRWIDYRLQGCLVIDNCQFEAFTPEQAGQIYVSGSSNDSSCIVVGGNFSTAANIFFTGTGSFYVTAALHINQELGTYDLIDASPMQMSLR